MPVSSTHHRRPAIANSRLPPLPAPHNNLTHSLQYGTQLTETVTFSSLTVSL